MNQKILFTIMIIAASGLAYSDYVLIAPEDYLSLDYIGVVDATVQGITEEGFAILKINDIVKGKTAPKVLKYISLSCTGPYPVSQAGVKKGKRYIFVTKNDNLYEWTTLWEVLQSFDGELKCYYTGGEKPGKNRKVIMPEKGLYKLSSFKERIKSVVTAK